MKGFLLLGLGAFATGAGVAVVMQRRTRVDDDFGEDPNWPAVPYTAQTHPDSPQEHVTAPVETPSPASMEASQTTAGGTGVAPPAGSGASATGSTTAAPNEATKPAPGG
ncbi:MAG: hypothetical protein ACR2PL_09835 [Dehalococcoidia bacterium]